MLCLSIGDIASWKTVHRAQPVRSWTLREVFSSLVGNESTYSQKHLSRPRPCLHLPVWMNAQVQITVCVCTCFSLTSAQSPVCTSLLLGLLMKESNWIFWGRGIQERAGPVRTPWREGRGGGQTCSLDYHCALFSLALSSQSRGLLSVWAGRLVREHFTSSACQDKGQFMRGYTNSLWT